MTTRKIVISIIAAAIIGGITQAAVHFPDLGVILTSVSALVTAALTMVNGADNTL